MNPLESFIWDIPTKVIFGPGCIKNLNKVSMYGKKALLVMSAGSALKANGTIKTVTRQLEESGVLVTEWTGVTQNPDLSNIMDGVKCAREHNCDHIIGLGAGASIDCAKLIAAILSTKDAGSVEKVCEGLLKKEIKRNMSGDENADIVPCVTISTGNGTGNEVTSCAVISDKDTKEKLFYETGSPVLAIIDPEVSVTIPSDVTAYQGFETLIGALCGYISGGRTAPAQMCQIAAIGNAAQFLEASIADGSDMDARTKLAFAGTMNGFSNELGALTGLPAISNVLCAHFTDLPYGAALIKLSVPFFRHIAEKNIFDSRFLEMAMSIGVAMPSKPMDFIYGLQELQRRCGVDIIKLSDYGIPEDSDKEFFSSLAKEAKTKQQFLFENDLVEISETDIARMYEFACK